MGQGKSSLAGIRGFQVVRVLPNSPAYHAGLLPYFDIITAVDNVALDEQQPSLMKGIIEQHKDKDVALTVFNLRVNQFRQVVLRPANTWGGQGLLGCSIEWATAEDCASRCWHIIEILENSPASRCAQIVADRDYVIGMQHPEDQIITMIRDQDDFMDRIDMWNTLRHAAKVRNSHMQQLTHGTLEVAESGADLATSTEANGGKRRAMTDELLLLIYNSEENSVQEVIIDMSPPTESGDVPAGTNSRMGDKDSDCIGLAIGSGLLHAIPMRDSGELPVLKHHHENTKAPKAAACPSTATHAAPAAAVEVHPRDSAAAVAPAAAGVPLAVDENTVPVTQHVTAKDVAIADTAPGSSLGDGTSCNVAVLNGGRASGEAARVAHGISDQPFKFAPMPQDAAYPGEMDSKAVAAADARAPFTTINPIFPPADSVVAATLPAPMPQFKGAPLQPLTAEGPAVKVGHGPPPPSSTATVGTKWVSEVVTNHTDTAHAPPGQPTSTVPATAWSQNRNAPFVFPKMPAPLHFPIFPTGSKS